MVSEPCRVSEKLEGRGVGGGGVPGKPLRSAGRHRCGGGSVRGGWEGGGVGGGVASQV